MKLDLATTSRDGNRLYYRANTDHTLHTEIRKLVIKTIGLVENRKSVLDRQGLKMDFVFGSLASSKEKTASN